MKEKVEKGKNEVNAPVAYEMEQCMGTHWPCDQSSEEECKCGILWKDPIQETVGART
jgi:hypothetical protein